ncbi:hypothetical protein AALP_AA5G278700 [Arabis alpina]|uniref:NYN domain-containing protein n=1 Tax=Arabis alpina TaxID=50452 RepID=A0A087GZT6_ARAAL|nr:hypothetical protein AALP_AA5G278700 [Arabis alpina]
MSAFPGNFAAAELGVFWDLEDCKMSENVSASETLQNIRLAISSSGHHGTVSIRAYGDMTGLEFPSDGIKVNHFPAGERFARARHTKMLEDIVSWSGEHPEPSNLMLILKEPSQDLLEIVELLKSRKNYMVHSVN